MGLHKRPHSPALFVQVTNSYFRFLLSAEAIKWLGQGLDDQVWERNDYVTIVGCWQGLIKAANNFIQTNRCSGRICQASRCSGRTSTKLAVFWSNLSGYPVFRSNLNQASGVLIEFVRLAGVPVESVGLAGLSLKHPLG